MPIIDDPNVVRSYIAHEGSLTGGPSRQILVIHAHLQTNPQESNFDLDALQKRIRKAEAYVSEHNRQIENFRIVPERDYI